MVSSFSRTPAFWGACLLAAGMTSAQAATVSSFATSPAPNGQWFYTDVRPGGTATIETLSGGAATGAPLPTGAAKLTTTDGASKAEVGVTDSYGTASNILRSLDLHFSYYKENVGQPAPAPSLKLSFLNPASTGTGNDRGFITLIWEAYVQDQPNSFTNPTPGVWTDVDIDFTSGLFWANQGFGNSNSFGGAPYRTLQEWLNVLNDEFESAQLVTVAIGLGSNNLNQVGYFDDVRITHSFGNGYSASYDFEAAAAVPEPGSLALVGLSLAALAVVRRRRS